MRRWALAFFLLGGMTVLAEEKPAEKKRGDDKEIVLPKGVPAKVARVLRHVDEFDEAPPGYQGGRHFGNFENRLPKRDRRGKFIKYREWDVNPRVPGKNRGPERLVTGSDRSAWYTGDHYETFRKIR